MFMSGTTTPTLVMARLVRVTSARSVRRWVARTSRAMTDGVGTMTRCMEETRPCQ